MIITNLKQFNSVCKEMQKFCKHDERLDGYKNEMMYHNVFFMDKNQMCATNGKFMAIRNMSDCVINDEIFAFPCNIKPTKYVTSEGEKFIIKSKREDYFSNDKKEVLNFNWERVIPTNKPRVIKEYNFSDYNPIKIALEKYSEVKFCSNGDVEFDYNDYYQTIAVYSDVQITKDDFFDSVDNTEIKEVNFPMYQIYWILNNNKNFIYKEYDEIDDYHPPRVFMTTEYKFLLMSMYNQ